MQSNVERENYESASPELKTVVGDIRPLDGELKGLEEKKVFEQYQTEDPKQILDVYVDKYTGKHYIEYSAAVKFGLISDVYEYDGFCEITRDTIRRITEKYGMSIEIRLNPIDLEKDKPSSYIVRMVEVYVDEATGKYYLSYSSAADYNIVPDTERDKEGYYEVSRDVLDFIEYNYGDAKGIPIKFEYIPLKLEKEDNYKNSLNKERMEQYRELKDYLSNATVKVAEMDKLKQQRLEQRREEMYNKIADYLRKYNAKKKPGFDNEDGFKK